MRVGISVSRAVGSAVVRNRTRRRLRQAARTLLPRLACGHDLVLIARPAAADASAAALEEALKGLARRAGLLGGDGHNG